MKPKILLLHGALGSSAQLRALQERLSDTYHCVIFNFHGHGEDAKNTADFSIENFALELKSFILKNEHQGITVFGYSMGGYVATYLNRHHPSVLGNLFTYGTQFEWNLALAKKEVQMLDPEQIEAKVPKFANQLCLTHGTDWKKVVHRTAAMMLKLGENPALRMDDYHYIQHRTLITRGSQDSMVQGAYSKEVSLSLLDSDYLEMKDMPHPLNKVDLDLLSSIIKTKW